MTPEQELEQKRKRFRFLQLEKERAEAMSAASPRERHGASGDWGYPDPGLPGALATKFNQGLTKDASDEIVGGVAGVALDETPGQYLKLPDGSIVPAQSRNEIYRAGRDFERQRQEGASQHWPKSSLIAQTGGEIASDVALAGSKMVRPAYQTAAGAFRGLMGSRAELTPDKATPWDLLDAGVSTGVGAGLGYGMSKIPAVADYVGKSAPAQAIAGSASGKRLLELLNKGARWPGEALDRAGIRLGRNVMSGAKGLKSEEMLSDEAVRAGMDAGAVRLFGTTGGASKRLSATRELVGDEYARVVSALRSKGVQGPEADALAETWLEKAANKEARSLGSDVPPLYRRRASEVLTKTPDGGRLGLEESIDITRDLQKQAKYGKFEETLLNRAKRDIASDVRGGVEKEVNKAASASADPELQSLAAEFRPIKRKMGNIIEADAHAFEEANRAASRKPFSLYDMMAGGGIYQATHDPVKTGAAMLGSHLLRTRGPSTAAVTSRWAGKGLTAIVEHAPQVLGEFGAVIAGQKSPEARMEMVEQLAARYPQFAEMIDNLTQTSSDGQASLSPGSTPLPGAPLRAGRRGR